MGSHVACRLDFADLAIWRLPCSVMGGDGHVEIEVATVHRLNNTIALQGVLALFAFVLLLVVAANALQPHHDNAFDPVAAAVIQEPHWATVPPASLPRDAQSEQSSVFHGTILRHGSDFLFREQTGVVYRLAAPANVKPFVGKTVKVTGWIEKDARLFHIQDIQRGAAA